MWCSSQSTYPKLVNDSLVVITPQQLKATNLVFLEHKKLKLENVELRSQVSSYELTTANYLRLDSLQRQQLARANTQIKLYDQAMQAQNEQLDKITKKKNRLVKLSTGLGILTTVLAIVLVVK